MYSEVPLESYDHAVVSVIFRLIPKHDRQIDWHHYRQIREDEDWHIAYGGGGFVYDI